MLSVTLNKIDMVLGAFFKCRREILNSRLLNYINTFVKYAIKKSRLLRSLESMCSVKTKKTRLKLRLNKI